VKIAGYQETKWFGSEVFNIADVVGLTSGKSTPVDGESCRGEGVTIVLMNWAIIAFGSQQNVSGRLGVSRFFLSVEEKLHGVFRSLSIITGGCWSYEYSKEWEDFNIFFAEMLKVGCEFVSLLVDLPQSVTGEMSCIYQK